MLVGLGIRRGVDAGGALVAKVEAAELAPRGVG
jgi:hypothetical protein